MKINSFKHLKVLLDQAQTEVTSLEKRGDNKAAAARLRKVTLELGKTGKEFRKESVQALK